MISSGKQSRVSALITCWLRRLISRCVQEEAVGRTAQAAQLSQNCQLASLVLVSFSPPLCNGSPPACPQWRFCFDLKRHLRRLQSRFPLASVVKCPVDSHAGCFIVCTGLLMRSVVGELLG